MRKEVAREPYLNGPLRPAEQQGRRRQLLAPGAQYVGRADIARPDLPADPVEGRPNGEFNAWTGGWVRQSAPLQMLNAPGLHPE